MATYYNVAHSTTDIRQAKLYTKDEVLSSPYYSPKGRGFTVFDGTSDKYPFCSTLDIEGLKKVGVYNTQNNETVYIYEGIPVTTTEFLEGYTNDVSTKQTYDNSHGLGYLISVYGGNGSSGNAGQQGEMGDAYTSADKTYNGEGGAGGLGGYTGRTIQVKFQDLEQIAAGAGRGGGGGGGGSGGLAGSTSSAPTYGGAGGNGGSGSLGEYRYAIIYDSFVIDSIYTGRPHMENPALMNGQNGTGGGKSNGSEFYSGRGGQSADGNNGGSGKSGSGQPGGNGGSATSAITGSGGILGKYGNTSSYSNGAVVISKYIVTGIR